MKKNLTVFLTLLLALFLGASPLALAADNGLPLPEEPRVKARAAIAYDLTNGEIILQQRMDEKMYPASLTKLMTALLLAENAGREDSLYISETPLKEPRFAINKNLFKLYKGDSITADAAMKAILLPSANDMAVVAAEHVGETVAGFVQLMNAKAKALGMTGTNFVNPTGLHDPMHYTTARDLVRLTEAAYGNEWIREIIATETADIRTKNQKIGEISNSNQLLGINGNVGGKTGFTPEAGRCLIGIYVRDGREIIQVLLDDGTTIASKLVFTDMENLANEAFKLKKIPFLTKGTAVDGVTGEYQLFRWFGPEQKVQVKAVVAEDLLFYNNTLNNSGEPIIPVVTTSPELDVFKLETGTPVAQISLTQGDTTLTTQALSQTTTTDSILIPNAVPYLGAAIGGSLGLILLVFLTYKLIHSRKSAQHKIHTKRKTKRRRHSKTRFSDKI